MAFKAKGAPTVPCPHGWPGASCCNECSPPKARTRAGKLLRAAWRDDLAFVQLAAERWPADLEAATSGGYDRGAAQKLSYRYQGWRAQG